jgi:hypothetical protein
MKTVGIDWELKITGWEDLNAGQRCDVLEAIIRKLNFTDVLNGDFDGSIGYDVED